MSAENEHSVKQKFEDTAKAIAADWAAFMEIDPELFEVQVGDFDVASFDAKVDERHVHAGTFGNPDNTQFIIAIRPSAPNDDLEQIIVHELWPDREGKDPRTCDARMCTRHRNRVGPSADLCDKCARREKRRSRQTQ